MNYKSKKHKLLFGLSLAVLFLLSGCIQMNIHENINLDGFSHVTITIDFSGLSENGFQGTEESGMPALNADQLCDSVLNPEDSSNGISVSESTSFIQKLSNVNCEAGEDFIVTITGTYQHPAASIGSEESFFGTFHFFDPAKSDFMEFPEGDQPPQGLAESFASITAIKAAGIAVTYRVELPGTITKAENGTIKNNTAEFDIIELAISQKKPFIESMEQPVPILEIVIGIIVVIILIIIIFVFVARKRKLKYGNPKEKKPRTRKPQKGNYDPGKGPPPTVQQRKSPRRLRRFRRNERTSPEEYSKEPISGWGEYNEERHNSQEQSEFGDVLEELKKETGRKKTVRGHQLRQDEFEILAQDITDQTMRDKKTKKEIDELKEKLGMLSETEEENGAAGQGSGRHGRRRKKQEKEKPVQEEKEHNEQLENLKAMEFGELLGEKKGKKNESELGELESELKRIEENGNETEEKEIQKCPNCQKETEKVYYCHECGTGFCSNCAGSYKKQGDQAFYSCPTCKTMVKE